MSIITLDFENFYRSAKNKGTPGPVYSLKSWTYEEYFFGIKRLKNETVRETFKVHGVGIKMDQGKGEWIKGDEVQQALTELFPVGNCHRMLGHNTIYDAAIMEWFYGVQASSYMCTQSMSKAIWPQQPANLFDLSKRCFPKEPARWKAKEDLNDSDGYPELSYEQDLILGNYCIQDLECTFDSFGYMWQLGFPTEELAVIDLLIKMFVRRPFKLDQQEIRALQTRVDSERQQKIQASGLPERVLSSNPQFAEYLLRKHSILVEEIPSPTAKNPDNVKYALAKDSLEFIEMAAAHPELDAVWKGRIAAKSTQLTSRIKRFIDHGAINRINPDGRIASYLGYYNAHTGRCGGGNRTTHQNLQQEIRPAIIAPAGQLLVIRDLSNIEGRVSAWFCEQMDKLDFIRDGGDIYNRLGGEIYGYPIDRKSEAHAKREGWVSKMAELALGYQMGASALRYRLAVGKNGVNALLTDDEACKIVNVWRTQNYAITAMWHRLGGVIADMADPMIEPYCIGKNDCIRVEYRRLVLPNGLALTYPNLRQIDHPDAFMEFEYWNGDYYTKLYGGKLLENIIQALSFIILKYAMTRSQKRFDESGNYALIGLNVHDELVAAADKAFAETANDIMKEEMARLPDWADNDLLLASDGGITPCYNK